MKGNVTDWRNMSLAALIAQRDQLHDRLTEMETAMTDLNTAINALHNIELNSEPTKVEKPKAKRTKRAKVKSTSIHWSKRPGADPEKVAAWKAKMAKVQRAMARAKR